MFLYIYTGVGMFDFIQRFIYFILNLQEKTLAKNVKKTCNSTYSNSTSKKAFAKAASLELTSETEKNKIKLENNVKVILKKYENNPHKLLEFIQKNGTKVYKIPYANKILKLFGYEEGFIIGTKGIKGLWLNIILAILTKEKIKLSFKTESMFIISNTHADKYFIIQQFHKWYAMKLNLPGFDSESQNNFQKFVNSNDEDVKSLSIEEILGLKEAIARDVEAINFIVDLAKSTTGSKQAWEKITTGGASV